MILMNPQVSISRYLSPSLFHLQAIGLGIWPSGQVRMVFVFLAVLDTKHLNLIR